MKKLTAKLTAAVLGIILLFSSQAGWAVGHTELVGEIKEYIDQFYIEKVDVDELPDSSTEELLAALGDRFSYYLSQAKYKSLQKGLEGNIGEIGIYVEQVQEYVTIQIVMNGSQAEAAGLQSGDQILAVYDRSVVGMPLSQVVLLLKGDDDGPVKMTIKRGEQILPVNVKPDERPESVGWARISETIGYVRISSFGLETHGDFVQAIDKLGTNYLIIDLRGNGGGYLSVVLNIIRELVPQGPVLQVEDRISGKRFYTAVGPGLDKPIILLTDNRTASAAEIMASALRDRGIALLVGTTTYGKASIQTLYNLSDGGVLRLTTARYFTAQGAGIDRRGLTPDYVVFQPAQQLQEAINLFQGYLNHRVSPVRHGNLLTLTIGEKIVDINSSKYLVDVTPFIFEGRSYLPLRFIAAALGAQVTWDQVRNEVSLVKEGWELVLPLDRQAMIVNGVEQPLEVPVILTQGRTLVPARFVAENLDALAHWENNRVYIYYPASS